MSLWIKASAKRLNVNVNVNVAVPEVQSDVQITARPVLMPKELTCCKSFCPLLNKLICIRPLHCDVLVELYC